MKKAAWGALLRFPTVFLVVVAAAIQIIALPGDHLDDWRWLTACSLGLPLTIAFHLFVENSPGGRNPIKEVLLGLLVFAVLILYGWALPLDPSAAPGYITHRHFVLLIGLHLLVSFASFLPIRNRWQFWSFNKTLFLRFLATFLFSGTLYLGLMLILGGLGALLGAGEGLFMALRWYVGVLIFLVFNTWFFLAGVPKPSAEGFPESPASPTSEASLIAAYPKILKNFCQYVLCPILLVGAGILLLLVTKGLMQGEHSPEPLSFAPLAVFGILAFLLIYPLDGSERWASLYRRLFFALLLPFVGIQFYELVKGVNASGLEESDYYLFVLSAWTGVASVYFLANRRAKILWLPVSLAAIAFLSVVGPWSAYSISKRSRMVALKSTGAGILPLEWKTAAKTINTLPADRSAEFYDRAGKINEFYGLSALAPILREPPPQGASWRDLQNGNNPPPAPGPESGPAAPLGISFSTHGSEDIVDVKGYDRYYRELEVVDVSQGPADCIFALCARQLPGENRIVLFDRKGGEKGRIDVEPFLEKLGAFKKAEIEKPLDPENTSHQIDFDVERRDLAFDFVSGILKGKFLFWTIFMEKSGKDLRLKSFQANVLLTEGK